MTSFLRDVRFGFRLLRKAPGFSAVAILALALGISANTSIFSVIYATYLAPLPLRDPDKLAMVWTQMRGNRNSTAPGDFVEWKRQADVFEELTAWTGRGVNLATNDRPEFVRVGMTTPSLMRMMGYGYPLALGRDFLDEEGIPGRDRVVVMSNKMWRERFGADAGIIGKQVRMDGVPYTIVGVLAAGAGDRHESQIWTPLAFTPEQLVHDNHFLNVMGRLKPGVTLEQANANMTAIAEGLTRAFPDSNKGKTVTVEPFRNNFVNNNTKMALWLLFGAVGFVLLIACANVANLLLARGTVRQRELAVRASVGASRGQILRQLMTESLVLAIAGGALGVVLAFAMLDVIVAILPPFSLPTEADLKVNVPVLLFTLGACMFSALLFGSAPAWQASRIDTNETLKEGGRSSMGARHGLRRALVALEFALALTLIAGGGLAIRGFFALANVDLGIAPQRLLTFSLPVLQGKLSDTERITTFYRQLLERVEAVPGVSSAAISIGLPVRDGGYSLRFSIVGQPAQSLSERPDVRFRAVSHDYFETFGIRIVRGRSFGEQDGPNSLPVAVVNETFVKRHLSNVDPFTQRIALPRVVPNSPKLAPPVEWQIVGVVRDARNAGSRNETQPEIIVPFDQSPVLRPMMTVRSASLDPVALQNSIASAVQSLDPDLPIANVKPMEQILSELMASDRFNSVLFGAFAAVALLLAAVGIYGVMSFVVAQRTHEIGLRVALGAARSRVLAQVLREGMMPALVGTALGSVGAYFASRAMRTLVYSTGAMDITAFVAVGLLLLGSAFLACYVPARRAASVDPMVALRKG